MSRKLASQNSAWQQGFGLGSLGAWVGGNKGCKQLESAAAVREMGDCAVWKTGRKFPRLFANAQLPSSSALGPDTDTLGDVNRSNEWA
jgi:hypothetical protein